MNLPLRLRLLLPLLLLLQPFPAEAFLRWGKKAATEEVAPLQYAEKTTRLRVGAFGGSSGSSAREALIQELTRSRAFDLVIDPTDTAPAFQIAGDSVGGRVTGRLSDSAGKPLFERSYAAPGLSENLQALSDDLIYTITGKPGLATSRIAFVSNQSGSKQIYLCNTDGGQIQQVTRHRHGAVSPVLSPDASLLAFTSYRSGFPMVTLMDLGGGMERVITDTPGSNFGAAFAPDSRHLALVMSFLGNPEIFVSDLATNAAGCLTETIGVPASPAWSPDGGRLVFSSDEGNGPQLFVLDFGSEKSQGGFARWSTGYRYATDPAWSPDGEHIAFTARSAGGWLVAMKTFPSGPTRVIQRGGRHPSWSPNGRYLIYVQDGDLHRHDLVTGARKTLVTQFGEISEPRWAH